MSFALFIALVMVLFSAGAATAADDGSQERPDSLLDDVAAGFSGAATGEPAQTTEVDAGNGATATTQPSATDAASTSTESSSAPVTDTVAPEQSPSADKPVDDTSSDDSAPTGPVLPSEMAEENPCLVIIEELATDLADLVAEDVAVIEELLNDPNPDGLIDFFEGLDAETAAEVEALLTEAADAFEECLAALPLDPEPTEPQPQPIAHPSPAEPVGYENCDEVRAAGAAPIHAGQPGYAAHLDSDHDGIGCEEGIVVTQPAAHTGAGQLAYTGVTVQPMIAWGAALVLSGGWLLRSARRRA